MVAKTTSVHNSSVLWSKIKEWFKTNYPDSSVWGMNESSGDFKDAINGFDLTASVSSYASAPVIRSRESVADFNGSSDYAELTGDSNFRRGLTSKLTVGGWFYPGRHPSNDGHLINVHGSKINIQCSHNDDTGTSGDQWKADWFIIADGGNESGSVPSKNLVPPFERHLICWTLDNSAGEFRIYTNSGRQNELFSVSLSQTDIESIDSITFGKRTDNLKWVLGLMGPVFFIPGTALSISEMDDLYALGKGRRI